MPDTTTVTLVNGSLYYRFGDKVYKVNGLTAADITKIKQALTDISSLKTSVGNINSAPFALAYKDYTVEANQGEMKEGLWYLIPQTKDNTFVQIDKNTGAPAVPSGENAKAPEVDHYAVRYKKGDQVLSLPNRNEKIDLSGYYTKSETDAKVKTASDAAAAAQTAADNAKKAADAAKSAADAAQSTANTAKSTADTAKTTADANKATLDGLNLTEVSAVDAEPATDSVQVGQMIFAPLQNQIN